MLAASLVSAQADYKWNDGLGKIFSSIGNGAGRVTSSPLIKKHKNKIIAGTAAVGGLSVAAYFGWWHWFKRPAINQIKADLLQAEIERDNQNKLSIHMNGYHRKLAAELDNLVGAPAMSCLNRAGKQRIEEDRQSKIAESNRAREITQELEDIKDDFSAIDASQPLYTNSIYYRIMQAKYQLGRADGNSSPILIKPSGWQEYVDKSRSGWKDDVTCDVAAIRTAREEVIAYYKKNISSQF